jgi:glycyl-tRNA synthetase (class II)
LTTARWACRAEEEHPRLLVDDMVRRRDDIVGIETSIIMHPKVWEASGHVAGFTDPLVDCKVSKQRYPRRPALLRARRR